jgi:hypothetical protein
MTTYDVVHIRCAELEQSTKVPRKIRRISIRSLDRKRLIIRASLVLRYSYEHDRTSVTPPGHISQSVIDDSQHHSDRSSGWFSSQRQTGFRNGTPTAERVAKHQRPAVDQSQMNST